jgi:type III pantothenate kinase
VRSLLLDVGNSRLKCAQAVDGKLLSAAAFEHSGDAAAVVPSIEAAGLGSIWISNVTGAQNGERLADALQARFAVQPQFAVVMPGHAGLQLAYAQPQRLGVDRWLGMLAQWTRTQQAFCIAGAGTALTFDAVDAGGVHLGGVIAPGLVAMQQAVLATTRIEAAASDQQFAPGLGADTEACIRQGALHAAAGLFERLAAQYGGQERLLAGGDAPRLLPHLAGSWNLRGNLVLEGLLALAHPAAVG